MGADRHRRPGASQRPGQPVPIDPYTERLAEAGVESSVGSRGDSYDNALAETIISLFKTEVIRRLLEPIGNIPPVEPEAAYYQQLEGSAMVA